MKQSPNDLKHYQALTLSNGLRVLLIQNKTSEKAAAALAVNVGHFNDPIERQGMAHFIEHMLFLGTEKYPDGSEYQKFISQYGGSNNAWTATEHTCFFFDINHQHFEPALERFCQFFTAPLLSEEFISKERQNIDAEFKLKLKDDIRRLYDVHKETINQNHPFSKFSVGTSNTLADKNNRSIKSELKAFFDQYYCAQYMTLVLESPLPLIEQQKLVEKLFSQIKQATTAQPLITEPLYNAEHQTILLKVKPVKNDRQLIISFAMPSIDKYYRHKPESVLAYLLGHEGPGSILSHLKHKQWAMGITAGSGINGSNFKDFNISIPLTETGEQHINEIVSIIFSYLNLLNKQPLPEHFYTEKQAIAELSYHYHEKQKALDSVCQLVINMQHYPVDDYIFGDYVMEGLCQKSIKEMLSYFSPSNMRLVHISQDNKFDRTSHWYQVPYAIEQISAKNLSAWATPKTIKGIFLPDINPYIIANPEVLIAENDQQEAIPHLIDKNDGLAIWFKQDNTFQVPKGYIYIAIDSPFSMDNLSNIAMTRLFVDLYTDSMTEEYYDAELAGIHYHLYAHQGGMTLQVSGISSKQSDLLAELLTYLQTAHFSKQQFTLFKEQLINHWENSATSKSISQLFSILSSTMQPKNPSSEALALALSDIDFTQFKSFSGQIFNEISLEVLIHGNWHKEHALIIADNIKKAFNNHYSAANNVEIPLLDIASQGELSIPLHIPEHDHAVVIYYPLPNKDLKSSALTMIISQLLSPLFFQEMRTEKQYGYLVGVGFVPINRYPGIAFYIQSPHTTAADLITAIDLFIKNSGDMVEQMTLEDWQQLQYGLAGQLKEKDSSLRLKSQRFWAAISNKEIGFSQKEKLIETILRLTLKDIRLFIEQHFTKPSTIDRITLTSNKNQTELNTNNALNCKIKNIEEITKNYQRKY